MAPPSYSDLGKNAKDIFNKNYNAGFIKLDGTTKSPLGMEFNLVGNSSNDNSKVDASLETKYSFKSLGAAGTFKEKWTTNNVLSSEISFNDLGTKGTKLGLAANFSLLSGSKQYEFKSGYKQDSLNINMDMNLEQSAVKLSLNGVAMYQGWALGGSLGLDAQSKKVTNSNVALGYIANDFELNTNIKNGQEFSGSIYQKQNSHMKSGIQVSWSTGNSLANVSYGCLYEMDAETTLRAKINNNSQIGIGMSHKLKPGLTFHLSTQLEGKNFSQGGHKLGFGLQMSA